MINTLERQVMYIHERVKTARILAGLSTEQLAKRLDLVRTNIVRWETESKHNLPRKQLERLAEATGVSVQFLNGGDMEGLVIARPGRFISKNARSRAYEYLNKVLPQLTHSQQNITEFVAEGRTVSIYHTDKLCIVIVPVDANVAFAPVFLFNRFDVSVEVLQEAFESNVGVAYLLEAAGLQAFIGEKKLTTIKLQISSRGEQRIIDKVLAVVDELRMSGCDVSVKISREKTDEESGVRGLQDNYFKQHWDTQFA